MDAALATCPVLLSWKRNGLGFLGMNGRQKSHEDFCGPALASECSLVFCARGVLHSCDDPKRQQSARPTLDSQVCVCVCVLWENGRRMPPAFATPDSAVEAVLRATAEPTVAPNLSTECTERTEHKDSDQAGRATQRTARSLTKTHVTPGKSIRTLPNAPS